MLRHSATFARYPERISESEAFFFSEWYDAIIDDDRSKNAIGLMMNLNMLIETEGGFDYCGADSMAIGIKYAKGTKCADA